MDTHMNHPQTTVPMTRTQSLGFPFTNVLVPHTCPECGKQWKAEMQVSAIDELEGTLAAACPNCQALLKVILIETPESPVVFTVEVYRMEDTQALFLEWANV